jgi:hypothetical protein
MTHARGRHIFLRQYLSGNNNSPNSWSVIRPRRPPRRSSGRVPSPLSPAIYIRKFGRPRFARVVRSSAGTGVPGCRPWLIREPLLFYYVAVTLDACIQDNSKGNRVADGSIDACDNVTTRGNRANGIHLYGCVLGRALFGAESGDLDQRRTPSAPRNPPASRALA